MVDLSLSIVFCKRLPGRASCLGEEHRDGIDLYYAHVQLLSERDLQRPLGHGSWPPSLGLQKLKGTRNMAMVFKKHDRTEAYPLVI